MFHRLICVVVILLLISLPSFGQQSAFSKQLESQLKCKANPQPAKLLVEMERNGSIRGPYVVEDSISYFRLVRPLRVLSFTALGVFGYQEGFPKFFTRGPGTSPPEMIGIVVRGNQDAVKLTLRKMGIDNLEIEPHDYNMNNGNVNTRSGLVAIACWSTK